METMMTLDPAYERLLTVDVFMCLLRVRNEVKKHNIRTDYNICDTLSGQSTKSMQERATIAVVGRQAAIAHASRGPLCPS